ncbi:MAG TPA: SurA N-terminal domain-containing protein [Blastocatellia bacterium]|nr:SurA N-terminal domain-containing protein [Blastocatellia bacterium]
MLRFFARFKGLHKLVFVFFCAVLLIGLVLFYAIPGFDLTRKALSNSGSNDGTVIAKVGSREVTIRDFRQQINALSAMYRQGGNDLPLAVVKALGLDKQALDRLIEEKLALAEADRLNITATDQEVSDQVKTLPGFQKEDGGFIGVDEYRRALQLRGENIEDFENNIRRSIILGKVRNLLGAAVQVSDKEIEEKYKEDTTQVDLVYAQIDQSKVRDTVKFTDDELKNYYDGHKDEFKTTEAVRKVQYVFVPTDKATATVPITEEELKKEYEERKQFEPRVSIIKLNVLTPQDDPTVSAKANELATRVRGTQQTKPEDFAAVARGNSQDPSAAKGGDIGFIKKDANRPNDWKQRAFNLKVGDIDGPFREGTSYYIMKVTEQRQVPYSEMRPTLEASLKNRKGYQRANEIADKVYEEFTREKDIKKAAEVAAKELKVSADTLIRTVPFFKKGDTLPEIGSNPAFESAVEGLSKNEIGAKIGVPNGIAVPHLLDVKEPGQQLNFDDAKFLVEQKLRSIREPDAVRAKAQEIVNNAKTPAELEAEFRKLGLDVKKDTNFNTFNFSSLQVIQQARTAALALKEGEVGKTPIKVGASWLMFAATKRKDPDMSKLAAERRSYQQRLLDEMQNLAFDAHVKAARQRYEKEGKLTIYQKKIDDFLNSAASEAQPSGQ